MSFCINLFIGSNTVCQQQRQDELNKAEFIRGRSVVAPGTFLPTCKENGDFEEMQCHGSTGYCWCVNEKGKKVGGVSPGGKDLNCERGMSSIVFITSNPVVVDYFSR